MRRNVSDTSPGRRDWTNLFGPRRDETSFQFEHGKLGGVPKLVAELVTRNERLLAKPHHVVGSKAETNLSVTFDTKNLEVDIATC